MNFMINPIYTCIYMCVYINTCMSETVIIKKNKGQKGGQGSYNFNIPCYFQRGSSFEIKHH